MKRKRDQHLDHLVALSPTNTPFPSLLPSPIPFSPVPTATPAPPQMPSSLSNNLPTSSPQQKKSKCSSCYKKQMYKKMLSEIISYPQQVVYCERKTWYPETKLPFPDPVIILSKGINLHGDRTQLPSQIDMIGAHGLSPSPPFQVSSSSPPPPPEKIGHMGLISYRMSFGGGMKEEEIVKWIQEEVCPSLLPFPGPRSVVVMDEGMWKDLSERGRKKIHFMIRMRGALIFFPSLLSFDCMFEHLWRAMGDKLGAGKEGLLKGIEMRELLRVLKSIRVSSRVCMEVVFGGHCKACEGGKGKEREDKEKEQEENCEWEGGEEEK